MKLGSKSKFLAREIKKAQDDLKDESFLYNLHSPEFLEKDQEKEKREKAKSLEEHKNFDSYMKRELKQLMNKGKPPGISSKFKT